MEQAMTRAEEATLFTRLLKERPIADEVYCNSFNGVQADAWYYNTVGYAAQQNIIKGYPDGSFKPAQDISRAEVTVITNRMLNRHADQAWLDANADRIVRDHDVTAQDLFYNDVMEAVMGHDYSRFDDGKTETWSNLNSRSFV